LTEAFEPEKMTLEVKVRGCHTTLLEVATHLQTAELGSKLTCADGIGAT